MKGKIKGNPVNIRKKQVSPLQGVKEGLVPFLGFVSRRTGWRELPLPEGAFQPEQPRKKPFTMLDVYESMKKKNEEGGT